MTGAAAPSPMAGKSRKRASLVVMYVPLLAVVGLFGLAGCVNEFMNSAMYSEETRIRKFREYHDQQLGKPYYGVEENVCGKLECVRRPDGLLEITWENTFEEGCTIVWVVAPTESKVYRHPTNGLLMDIIGIKYSWHYDSNPEKCLYGLDWEGPW